MLSKRLEALSKDPSNPDSIAELVVTALGPQGSFYICWKTVSGRHEQDSHGLPAALHEWLFPRDGGRRDFETLQVILGPREGEFFASDCHGKRDQKPAEPAAPPQQQPPPPPPLAGRLRRASTLWQQQHRDPANHRRLSFIEDPEPQPPAAPAATTAANKRLSFIGDPAAEAKGNRRRSSTLSSLGWASSSRRTLSLPKVPLDPAEHEDQRRARRTTLLPLALQAGGPAPFVGSNSSNSSNTNSREATAVATAAAAAAPAPRRPDSPPSRGPSRAGSLRASASNHSLNSVASRESAGNFSPERRRTPPRPSIPEEEPPTTPRPTTTTRPAPRRPVSVYADAGIQTDPVPEDDALSEYHHHHHQQHQYGEGDFVAARRARGMSTASDASTVFSRAATETSSRRTSMESDIKIDPTAVAPCWLEQQQQQQEEQLQPQQQQQWETVSAAAANFNPNPVIMGRMQDYFRSPAYSLGDAFRPTLGSGMYWGSWRQ